MNEKNRDKQIAKIERLRDGEVGVANSTRAKRNALEMWREENVSIMGEMIEREMMRVDNIWEMAMEDYERSRRVLTPMEYAALMARGMSMDEIDEMFASRGKIGDPKILNTLIGLSMQRMRMIGVVGSQDRRKQVVNQYNFGNLSEEEMKRLVGEMQDNRYKEEVGNGDGR